jgi:membrane fusion protein
VVQAAELARTRHDAQLVALSRQIESSREARSLAEQRVTLAEERLESVRKLQSEGASSREEARIREEALIAQQQQLADLRERTSALEESVTLARLDRKRVDDNLEIQIADLNSRAAQLDLQLAQTLGQVGYSIVAPASGRIAALQVASGDRVDASRPVLTILPEGVPLVAELAVPSRVVAQLAIGQRVQLGIDFASASERDHVAGEVDRLL